MAQTLTAVRRRQRQKALNPSDGEDGFLSIEIHDLDRKVPWPEDDYMTPASKRGPPPFDFERLTRFMAYGFMMAPVQHKWFGFLNRIFPIVSGEGKGTTNALRRVAFDQFLFAPVGESGSDEQRFPVWQALTSIAGLAAFFTFMTVAEGGGKRAVVRKFQDVYLPALKANFIVWPLVQVLNFRVMPIQFQIVSAARTAYLYETDDIQPFVSTVGIFWTAYLSLTNSSDEPVESPVRSPAVSA